MIKLSEQLKRARADRPDEWIMDRYIDIALELEAQVTMQDKVIDKACEWIVEWCSSEGRTRTKEKIKCDLEESVWAEAKRKESK